MLSQNSLTLNILPAARCPMIISPEILGSDFGNCNTLFSSTNQNSTVLDMVTFPTRSVTFPRYHRTEREPSCEFSAAISLNVMILEVSVTIFEYDQLTNRNQLWRRIGRELVEIV